ncbi:facilitated trehalose transporter Tret1-like isoform X1 [Episyrphus balteatus]|uniref:facilitated trehalose transporter Tret1-like isoform X1 n=1 Tax=Episyrphus balteatus TaxID=286459 RepID=UPI00248544B8|nr:facilitated trehalose transporter Tret1-like isoform X1 [Episyrphus balteatus]
MLLGLPFNNPGSVFCKNYRQQLASTLIVNLITLSHGIAYAWVSPMLFKLQSDDSPLEFRISVEEASWIGGLTGIGGLAGNVIFGILLDSIGRKLCIYLVALPHIGFWIMVYFATDVSHLYMARLFGGFAGGGIYVLIPIFVSEIADAKVRGRLGSLFCFSLNVGILSGYIIASHIPYLVIPCLVVILPILYLLLAIHFPETPQHLLHKGLVDDAEKSLKFYKNYQGSSKINDQKFSTDFNELKLSVQCTDDKKEVSYKDFLSKRSLKALCSGVVLAFVNSSSGVFVILNYSSMIFAETHSTMDPNTNTIIIGAVQIVGSYCATVLVDRHGRKILMLLSTSGMFLGLTTIGAYSYFADTIDLTSMSWLPVVIISFVIFSANIGVVAVTFVLLVEVLPPKIRSLGSTFCLVLMSVFVFTVLKLFPILMVIIGLAGVMWICASISGFGFLYVLLFLRETKGKSLDDDNAYD